MIEWLDDSLPDLAAVRARKEEFDLVMLTAVWMHLDEAQRELAMPNVSALVRNGGIVIVSLRHGPIPPGWRMFEVSAEETIALAQRLGSLLHTETERRSLRCGNPESVGHALAFQKDTGKRQHVHKPMVTRGTPPSGNCGTLRRAPVFQSCQCSVAGSAPREVAPQPRRAVSLTRKRHAPPRGALLSRWMSSRCPHRIETCAPLRRDRGTECPAVALARPAKSPLNRSRRAWRATPSSIDVRGRLPLPLHDARRLRASLDPGAVIRPVPGEWHPRMPERLDEEELADWRAGRNAVYQLAALTIGARPAVADMRTDCRCWMTIASA